MTSTDIRPQTPSRVAQVPAPRDPLTVRLARSSARHPWRALSFWTACVIVCLIVGSAVGLKGATDLDLGQGQSGRAEKTLHDVGLADPVKEQVLITRGTTEQRQRAAVDVTARMRTLKEVASIDPPQTRGDATLVTVTMAGDSNDADDHIQPLLDATAASQKTNPITRVEEVGTASVDKGVNDNVAKDLGKAGTLSLPVTLVIMLIAFGAIVAAGVPLLLALSSVGAATGLSMIASHLLPGSGTTSSVILMIGMAVGVDYSLFYLKRAREEEAAGASRFDAIEAAARTSGHSVIVSGLAVMVSMAGLFLANDLTFSSLAVGSILVVAVAVIGSLTVVPAMLAGLGKKLNRPRIPVLWRLSMRQGEPRLWNALLKPAINHPRATLVASVLAMLALAAPTIGMHLQSDSAVALPRSIPVVQSLDRLNAAFPSQESSHEIVVSTPSAADADAVEAALTGLTRNPVRASKDGRVHASSVDVPFDSTSKQAKQSLAELRDKGISHALQGIPGATFAVTGDTAEAVDYDHNMRTRLPWVIGFVLALTFLMMVWTFRSVVVGLTTIAVNLLSASAAFGILTWVFQGTWAQDALGFRSTGTLVSWIPLFVFVVLFGLSMDYHVFVVSRIREAVTQGHSSSEAVRRGITRSAGVVTSAAIVMVSVFAVFASLSMIEMKEIGVGLGIAVLLDALVVRAVVLPSIMTLLGRANWWPSHLSRRA